MSWLPKQKVVVPVDFSDESIVAVDSARELVRDASHLYVIHVLPVLEPAEPGVIWTTIDDDSRRKHAQQALRERLVDAKYKDLSLEIAFGDAGEEITAFAERIGADLIVQPSHGRRGLRRMLLGSVAERVVRLATCPVLVLKHRKA